MRQVPLCDCPQAGRLAERLGEGRHGSTGCRISGKVGQCTAPTTGLCRLL
jgi:hypothetical protein